MDSAVLRHKILSSFLTLTFRKAAIMAINYLVINIVLAKYLPVETIGVLDIANYILTFFTYFADIGLAAALIQKKEINEKDLTTTFTIQEILTSIVSLVVIIGAPFFADYFVLGDQGVWLIRALGFSFFLTSLKVIPIVMLERELKFSKTVTVELIEAIVFNCLLVYLAFNNFDVNSFTYAVLARSIVGVVAIYILAPRRISIGIDKASAKSLVNFGIPFQVYSLLALFKDRLIALVVAKIVGAAGVSYIGWAQGLAFLPLEVMNQLNVIIFPLYSRLQDDKSELKETAGKMIFLLALILCPMWLGISALTPSLIDFVGAHKWLPAEQLVYLFIFGAFWASLSTPATILLNAVGQVKISLKLMVMWTILEWVITPLTTWYFGFVGFGISYGIISLTSIIPLVIIKRKFDIAIWSNVRAPLILSIVMSIPVYFIAQNFVHNFLQLLLVAGSGAVIYGALLLAFIKPKVIDLVKSLRR